jgi:putative peptide zinc metalloprotease protein
MAGGKREFLLEDPSTGRFHLLGAAEYFVASSFNGERSLPQVIEVARQKIDDFDLYPQEAAALAQWLLAAQIVELPGLRPPNESKQALAKLAGGVLYFRVSFGTPDRWVKKLAPHFAWLFSMPALAFVLILATVTAGAVAVDLSAFTASFSDVFAPDHHWRMLLAWIFLKAIHELGHAIACRRFGGEVRDFGVAFFFLAPAPYVDVTSCWRFQSKWQRIAVAMAGMYMELIAAIAAALVWRFNSDPVTRQVCVNLISLATITTVLFNINPLMRYDGYYALSDLLGWPNLAADGKACVAQVFDRYVLGAASRLTNSKAAPQEATPALLTSHRPTIALFLFGVASTFWQTATMLGLAIFAVAAYEGLGVVIAMVIGIPFLLAPICKMGAWMLRTSIPTKTRLRAAALLAIGCAFVAWISISVPWPQKMRSAGFVEFSDVAILRAISPGNIAKLHVADGQSVMQGDLIATLENAELVTKAERDAADAQLSDLRARGHLHQQRLSDYQTENALTDSKAQAVLESQRQVDALAMHSPISGVVMARRLADQEGMFLKEGEELCKVAQGKVEIRLSVPQRDIERFQSRIGKTVSVRLASGTLEGEVISLDPMGSLAALDPALLAPMGGPLAARAKPKDNANADTKDAWTLPEPHFLAKVRVDNAALPAGFAGQRAEVSFYAWDRTIARQIADFFIARFEQAQSTAQN